MARIGYARVSTIDQDLESQHAKLKAEGCEIVRSEKVSGGSRDGRTELATVLDFLRPGDELVVTRLDRLGRDTRDVLNLIYECEQKGAFVTVLDPHVSDLPLNCHPAAIRASTVFDPIPFFGPPEGGVFRLFHDGGLTAPSGLINEIGTLCPIAPCGRTSL